MNTAPHASAPLATARLAATFCLALSLGALLGAPSADAAELRYAFKKGKTYTFDATSDDTISLDAMGIKQDTRFVTDTSFAIRVRKVSRDGTAQADIVVTRFSVKDDKGRKLASLKDLPKNALSNRVEIDAKGHFVFKQLVYLILDDKHGYFLVSLDAEDRYGASATTSDGKQQLNVYARFDPKTGRVSAGYGDKTLRKPRRVSAQVEADAPKLDILPTQFLELLALPDGDLKQGQRVELVTGPSKVTLEVKKLTKKTAELTSTMRSDIDTEEPTKTDTSVKAKGPGGKAEMKLPGIGAMPGMPAGMGALPGMPGAGAPQAGAPGAQPAPADAGAPAMKMTIDGAFDSTFSLQRGMLEKLGGTLKTATSHAGLKMGTTSKLKMTLRSK